MHNYTECVGQSGTIASYITAYTKVGLHFMVLAGLLGVVNHIMFFCSCANRPTDCQSTVCFIQLVPPMDLRCVEAGYRRYKNLDEV